MTDTERPRWPRIALAVAVPLLAALALSRWTTTEKEVRRADRSPVPATDRRSHSRTTPALPAATTPRAAASEVLHAEAVPTGSSRTSQPTPGIFDFASITPRQQAAPTSHEERFVTNERFTQQDLEHPERYFEAAAHAPALNKPEARRDTLEFFLAYRAKLEGDLDVPANAARRTEIVAVIDRYDDAIERLRALMAGE
jgi:hypothetical protein